MANIKIKKEPTSYPTTKTTIYLYANSVNIPQVKLRSWEEHAHPRPEGRNRSGIPAGPILPDLPRSLLGAPAQPDLILPLGGGGARRPPPPIRREGILETILGRISGGIVGGILEGSVFEGMQKEF